jgi:hypothetical protein|tara:strand:+ start:1562 stop:2089 length:528 start_codon:yes stop_codon:yes gene_type:complete
MDKILGIGLRKFIKRGNYLQKYNSNLYTHTCVVIKNGKVNIQTNTGLDTKGLVVVTDFINESNFENIILSVRTEKEPFSSNYPSGNTVRRLLNNRNNKCITLFNQEPWPITVPNFSDSNLVIRFGFDEECEFDKLQLKEPLSLTAFGIHSDDDNYQNGTYHYLVNNEGVENNSLI